MKRFEYKTIEIKPTGTWKLKVDITEIDKILNEMGSQGWELVVVEDQNLGAGNTVCFFYTFKREM